MKSVNTNAKWLCIALTVSLLSFCNLCYGLIPSQILIVANSKNPESTAIAEHYAQIRNVPSDNILQLDLPSSLSDSISRADYENYIAGTVKLSILKHQDIKIRCVLLTYGIPYKVGKRLPTQEQRQQVEQLTKQADAAADKLYSLIIQVDNLAKTDLKLNSPQPAPSRQNLLKTVKSKFDSAKSRIDKMPIGAVKSSHLRNYDNLYQQVMGKEGLAGILANLDLQIAYLNGDETNASVDSELSMVMYDNYELFRYQPNLLKGSNFYAEIKTVMVSRLDGPTAEIANDLVDKAIAGEKGLKGIAYFDARGITDAHSPGSFGYYDKSIRNAADLTRVSGIKTVLDNNEQLFTVGQCPDTILYCGWYSLKKYIPSFEFKDGAVGYHIASWEAIDIHDANSTQWVPAMLKAGITATFGAVAEPYLHAFPEPDKFFSELLIGSCLVEAYYKTKPFNSWQLILIGDPLYKPF